MHPFKIKNQKRCFLTYCIQEFQSLPQFNLKVCYSINQNFVDGFLKPKLNERTINSMSLDNQLLPFLYPFEDYILYGLFQSLVQFLCFPY